MSSAALLIKPGLLRTRENSEKILNGITPEIFARKPQIGGKIIDTTHPAWVFGHLSIYPQMALKQLSLDYSEAAVPENYSSLFANGSPCTDDADGTIYPPMSEIISNYTRSHEVIIASLDSISDELLARPHPEEARRARFGTLGGFFTYLFMTHPPMHLGQISTWRRCMGLGPA